MPLSILLFSHQHRFIFQFPHIRNKKETRPAHCCLREINEAAQRASPMNSISSPSFHVCAYKQSEGQLKYIPLPARLPCPTRREQTSTVITIHEVPEKEECRPPRPNASLVSRSDRKTFVSCHSLVKKLFQKATEGSWVPRHRECFHFLDSNTCDAICSKEKAFRFGHQCCMTVPGPRPVSGGCGERSPADQTVEQGQFQQRCGVESRLFGEERPTYRGEQAPGK